MFHFHHRSIAIAALASRCIDSSMYRYTLRHYSRKSDWKIFSSNKNIQHKKRSQSMHPFALLELIISHQYNSKALEYVRGPMPPSKYEKLLNQNWIKLYKITKISLIWTHLQVLPTRILKVSKTNVEQQRYLLLHSLSVSNVPSLHCVHHIVMFFWGEWEFCY